MGCGASTQSRELAMEQAVGKQDAPLLRQAPTLSEDIDVESVTKIYEKATHGTPLADVQRTSNSPLPIDGRGVPTPPSPLAEVDMMSNSHVSTDGQGVQVIQWPQRFISEAPDHPWAIHAVLAYLPWSQVVMTMSCISQSFHKFLDPRDESSPYWRMVCRCFCAESLLYLPAAEGELLQFVGSDLNYRRFLTDLLPLRYRFIEAADEEADAVAPPERFRVSTFCRMRPASRAVLDGAAAAEMLSSTPVQLPLNQRVALLQQKNPSLSRGEAMRMLLNKKCGAAGPLQEEDELAEVDNDVQASADLDPGVMCGSNMTASVLSVTPGVSGSLLTVSPGIGIRSWSFANVFGDSTPQSSMYKICGLRLAINLMNGQSGALIVYGQTGSGKTHTMFGGTGNADGLVPRIADEVLSAMAVRCAAGFEVSLGASYVEIFGNDVNNLVGGPIGANRGENQRMGHRYVLDGQCEEPVPDREALLSLLSRGEEHKRSASTEMNERSSRAHTVFILRLRQRAPGRGEDGWVESTLSLVDLGGSERVTKSKANEKVRAPGALNVGDEEVSRVTWQEYYRCRERITETNNINNGLMIFKRCVQALNERQRCAKEGKPLPRVPFNDSKLTMLLQPALSGNSDTSIVICCSPEDRHAEETVQSLRFGEMCACVEQERSSANRDSTAAVASALRQIDAQIKEVESVIRQKERWEWRTTIRVDVVDEKDTGGSLCNKQEVMELGGAGAVEIQADDGTSKKRTIEHEVRSQVLVGAEAENARREELLRTRRRLLGEE
mmetsp:Transcript_102439/g.181616  ORF Transcript_102439/g.181616 Transcript_102439/m.181616 type:complete len:780 (+) Transcript_102439:89-2428(+)